MDKSLEQLFVIEQETQLDELLRRAPGLLVDDQRGASLRAMERAAHSLKGAARLVGRSSIEKAAHTLEDLLRKYSTAAQFPRDEYGQIRLLLEQLGAKSHQLAALVSSDVTANTEAACSAPVAGSVLHLSPESIGELINLASEIAVSTKRLESLIAQQRQRVSSADQTGELELEAQRAIDLSTRLQATSYRLRLVPVQESMRALIPTIEQLAESLQKEVRVIVRNASTMVDRELIRAVEPCLIQLVRNSVDHGIEAAAERAKRGKKPVGSIELSARRAGAYVEVRVRDDGEGIDLERIRTAVVARGLHSAEAAAGLQAQELFEFLFLPGFSTRVKVSEVSGRGIGLDIVKTTLRELGGDVSIQSEHGAGTTFILRFPSSVASTRVLIAQVKGALIGLPLSSINYVVPAESAEITTLGREQHLVQAGALVPVADSARTFQLPAGGAASPVRYLLVVTVNGERVALPCERIEAEQEVVVHPLDARFSDLRGVLGIASGVGERIVTVIDPDQLVISRSIEMKSDAQLSSDDATDQARRVLIVDDSITVRELERRLLIGAGFECVVAVDGVDGLVKYSEGKFDLIITDIDMPRMDGFGLLSKLRDEGSTTPTLVVSYKERPEDRDRSMQLGAAAYLSKGSFKDDTFLSTVRALVTVERSTQRRPDLSGRGNQRGVAL